MARQNRQPKKGDKRRAVILKSLRNGCTVSAACGGANVARQTFYGWKNQDPGFAENVELAQGAAAQEIEDTLLECARKALDDPKYQTSLIFYCKARLHWKDNGEPPANEAEDDGPDPEQMSDEQLERYLASLDALANAAGEA